MQAGLVRIRDPPDGAAKPPPSAHQPSDAGQARAAGIAGGIHPGTGRPDLAVDHERVQLRDPSAGGTQAVSRGSSRHRSRRPRRRCSAFARGAARRPVRPSAPTRAGPSAPLTHSTSAGSSRTPSARDRRQLVSEAVQHRHRPGGRLPDAGDPIDLQRREGERQRATGRRPLQIRARHEGSRSDQPSGTGHSPPTGAARLGRHRPPSRRRAQTRQIRATTSSRTSSGDRVASTSSARGSRVREYRDTGPSRLPGGLPGVRACARGGRHRGRRG